MIDRHTRGVHQRQIDLVKVQPKTSHTIRYGVQGLLISISLSGKIPGFCRATVPRASHLPRQSHATSNVVRIRTRLSSIRGVLLTGLMAWHGVAWQGLVRLVSSRLVARVGRGHNSSMAYTASPISLGLVQQ